MSEGIAILFRFHVKDGMEDAFASAWAEVTTTLLAHGSCGSALFRDTDGAYRALARWPDADTRARAFAAGAAPAATDRMRACLSAPTEAQELRELANFWTIAPHDHRR